MRSACSAAARPTSRASAWRAQQLGGQLEVHRRRTYWRQAQRGRSCPACRRPRTARRRRRPPPSGRWRARARGARPSASSGQHVALSTRRAAIGLLLERAGPERRAMDAARLPISSSRLTSALRARADADHADPPAGGERVDVRRAGSGAPTSSSTTSKGPWASKSSGSTARGAGAGRRPPRGARRRRGRWPPPWRRPRTPAGRPRCPPRRRRRARRAARPGEAALGEQGVVAVVYASGNPPACAQDTSAGTGMAVPLVDDGPLGLTAAADDRHHPVADREAARRRARGRRPRRQLEPGDVGGRRPAGRGRSRPPGGRSALLSPAARTATSTSPAPARGRGARATRGRRRRS